MKKTSLFALLLALALSACGTVNDTPPVATPTDYEPVTTTDTAEAIKALLTRDYIAGYYWYCDGLAADGDLTQEDYYPVRGETLESLKDLVENTYTESLAGQLMAAVDTEGRARFTEREGKLYKSAYPVLAGYYWDYDAESISITAETAERVDFTVGMTNLMVTEDTDITVPLAMVRQNGAWVLNVVSVTAAEGETAVGESEAARDVAERFLTALTENDTAAIAACAGEAEGTYADWLGMTIDRAELTEVLEEYDGYGRYRVEMETANAFGVFGRGTETYLLVVSSDYDETPVVCYYEPEDKVAYNFAATRSDAACAMTDVFLNYEGYLRYDGSFWLDDETATDFAMAMLTYKNPAQTVFTAEEVAAAAESYLGIKDFTPSTAEKFAGEGGYILPGRSMMLGHYLMWPSYSDGAGHTMVKVEHYADHLNTQNCQSYLFTYKTNADDSLCLLSIT